MAQRGILPVLQFRGRIRSTMRGTEKKLEQLIKYTVNHPANPPYTPAQLVQMLAVKDLVTASLANRVKV